VEQAPAPQPAEQEAAVTVPEVSRPEPEAAPEVSMPEPEAAPAGRAGTDSRTG